MNIKLPYKRKQSYLKLVGNISVMRQSRAALPQLITLLNTADTIRFCFELVTKYIPVAQRPDEKVLKTETRKDYHMGCIKGRAY
jgi:hypothetical protein